MNSPESLSPQSEAARRQLSDEEREGLELIASRGGKYVLNLRLIDPTLAIEHPEVLDGAEPEDFIKPWPEDPDQFDPRLFEWASSRIEGEPDSETLQQRLRLFDLDHFQGIPDQFGIAPEIESEEDMGRGAHVLITPKQKVDSFASLDPSLDKEVKWLNDDASDTIFGGGKVVKVEHGMCGCANEQAHVHWIELPDQATEDDLEEAIDQTLARRGIGLNVEFDGDKFDEPHDLQFMAKYITDTEITLPTGLVVDLDDERLSIGKILTCKDLVEATEVDVSDFPNNVRHVSGISRSKDFAKDSPHIEGLRFVNAQGLISLGEKWQDEDLPTGSLVRPYVWFKGIGPRTSFIFRDPDSEGKGLQSQFAREVVYRVWLNHNQKMRDKEALIDSDEPRMWDRREFPDRTGMFATYKRLAPHIDKLHNINRKRLGRIEPTFGFVPYTLPPEGTIREFAPDRPKYDFDDLREDLLAEENGEKLVKMLNVNKMILQRFAERDGGELFFEPLLINSDISDRETEIVDDISQPNPMIDGILKATHAAKLRDDFADGNKFGSQIYLGTFQGNLIHFELSLDYVDPQSQPDLYRRSFQLLSDKLAGICLKHFTPEEADEIFARNTTPPSMPQLSYFERQMSDGFIDILEGLVPSELFSTSPEETKYKVPEFNIIKSAETKHPTEQFGIFDMAVYVNYVPDPDSPEEDIFIKKEHVLLSKGNLAGKRDVWARMQSICIPSMVLRAADCDCDPQLEASMYMVSQNEQGLIILENDEGRGHDLTIKTRARNNKYDGDDTFKAVERLGLEPDKRTYDVSAFILRDVGAESYRLITNNPNKVQAIEQAGIAVSGTIPIGIKPNELTERHLRAKAEAGFSTLLADLPSGLQSRYSR